MGAWEKKAKDVLFLLLPFLVSLLLKEKDLVKHRGIPFISHHSKRSRGVAPSEKRILAKMGEKVHYIVYTLIYIIFNFFVQLYPRPATLKFACQTTEKSNFYILETFWPPPRKDKESLLFHVNSSPMSAGGRRDAKRTGKPFT